MPPILEISNVDQSFRVGFWMKQVQVLFDVSLKVPERAIFGFLGANGAGKTTLIHLMTGLRKPSRGTVQIMGHEATALEARRRIGYLPERPYFYDHLTGDGVLRYFGALSGMPRPQILSRVPQVLKTVGLSHARGTELKRFSKGMLQRIGIAQALLHDPQFLILDEPMSGLDPMGRKEIRELIVHLAGEGRTILFSSHVIPDVEAICDQVALIQQGRLLGCGPIGQFLATEQTLTEVAFAGISAAKAEGLGVFESVRVIPDGIRATVKSQKQVDSALKLLLSQDASILWVQPLRPSLESLFAKKEATHD